MANPLVSVIIPTYGGADFLGKALRSVLDQTYTNFELIVVDDHSPDNTREVVAGFTDPRIKYIRHEQNQGAATARGTGRQNASGEIFAFLDQDDVFHREKLEAHIAYLGQHPEVGFSYNPYFELIPSSDNIRTVFQPPRVMTLPALTLGFYLPPSSWVVRREWAFHEEIWDANAGLRGREIMVCGRLFMAGCKFGRVDRVLQYRAYHAGRKVRELEQNCRDELLCQEIIFSDPRCPQEVRDLKYLGQTNINMMWADVAFAQSETEIGRSFLWNIHEVNPSFFAGNPSPFIDYLMNFCADDESHDFKTLLDRMISQIPTAIPNLLPNYLWALAHGHLMRGVRALLWDRPEDARMYLSRAADYSIRFDDSTVQKVTHELLGYELAHGEAAAARALERLVAAVKQVVGRRCARKLRADFWMNKAMSDYQAGRSATVPRTLSTAILNHPRYLLNRGVVSVMAKSVLGVKSMNPARKTAAGR